MNSEFLWMFIGFVGQALFASRFIVQWIASEREKRSVIPTLFWVFSLIGGVFLTIYAIYRRDPVFISGQVLGFFIYLRNLQMVLRQRKEASTQLNNNRSSSAPEPNLAKISGTVN